MKDIFYMDKIIPSTSIDSVEINYDICDDTYSIIVRQSRSNLKLISSQNKDLVKIIFDKIKSQCDGIDFMDLKEKSDIILKEKNNKDTVKTKEKRKKVSDKNDRKE